MQWSEVRDNLRAIPRRESYSWRSIRRSALLIIDEAQRLDVKPELVNRITPSNWGEIAAAAKRAIAEQRPERLVALLHMASELPTYQLRVALHLHEREEVPAVETREGFLVLRVTHEQLARIQHATRRRYDFRLMSVT